MRYAVAAITTFTIVFLVAALGRGSWLSRETLRAQQAEVRKEHLDKEDKGKPSTDSHDHHAEKDTPAAETKDEHSGHATADSHAGHDMAMPEKPVEVPPAAQTACDLRNTNDPVTGEAIDPARDFTETNRGFIFHFASEEARKKFKKNPVRYFAKLSLEPHTDGTAAVVDATNWPKAAPPTCGVMGGDIDPEGDVLILHRGFKVFFCCWSGCADEFLQNPNLYYDHYGLVERDGKLVKKE